MTASRRVDLAHEPAFVVGRLTVAPSRREIVRDDGVREVIEHRVMQVLVALAKANGGIVTRDELVLCCWEGRVVGDDAINRVIGRLRKVADGIGAGSFRIETITKIGHRLTHSGKMPIKENVRGQRLQATRRRFALGAGATAAALAAGGGTLLYGRLARPSVPPEIEALMVEADQALNQVTYDGLNQAIGLYRRVVAISPDFADGWGMLGFAYAMLSHYRPRVESEALRHRAETAGRRALALVEDNANGELALAMALPLVGHWREKEAGLERALAADPDNYNARRSLATHLYEVGRIEESLSQYRQIRTMRCPAGHHGLIAALWSAGRIEEAERAMEEAVSLYPTHPALWYLRYDLQAFGGHPTAALAMANSVEERPAGLPDELATNLQESARAIQSRDSQSADAVMRDWMRAARESVGASVIAIRMASALGHIDEAFAIADAYHLDRGFTVPSESNRGRAGADVPLDQRSTGHLFEPVTEPMRADRRFETLVEGIGLTLYWREVGAQPDYRSA